LELLGETAAFTVAFFLMLVGLVGIILPVIPGLVLIWFGSLIFAIAEGFSRVGPGAFALLTLLAIIGISADIWMAQLGAKLGGATFRSQLVGLAGGVLGAVLIPLLGGLIEALLGPVFGGVLGTVLAALGAAIGSVIGVLAAEYHRLGEWRRASRAGCGWLAGWLASTIFQLVMGGLMIVLFLWQAFSG
jgi:uncharacterized protein YqgC (DUF456 family)